MGTNKKNGSENLISNKIIDIVKKLESKNQNRPTSMDCEGKNKEILMYNDGFFNLINNQNISKIQKTKKIVFPIN